MTTEPNGNVTATDGPRLLAKLAVANSVACVMSAPAWSMASMSMRFTIPTAAAASLVLTDSGANNERNATSRANAISWFAMPA